MKKYVIVNEANALSESLTREEAISKVKDLNSQGVSAYIVSEAEGNRIRLQGSFNTPKWE